MASKYHLHVTAGPTYTPSTHSPIPVNTTTATTITTPTATITLRIKIQNYRPPPPSPLPSTSPYFSHPPHTHDKYSIAFTLTPHTDIPASSLVFGNDFDKPVRDRLPPGFGTAFGIVKRFIDPGIEGDFYADRPYLFGCGLSSFNVVWVGNKTGSDGPGEDNKKKNEGAEVKAEVGGHESASDEAEETPALTEGGTTPSGLAFRHACGAPGDMAGRKKWALDKKQREKWVWEAGREYGVDFFNGYLDFNEFKLVLPGFSIGVGGWVGGEDYLRYVLKVKGDGEGEEDRVLMVIVFALVEGEEEEEKGSREEGGEEKGGEEEEEGKEGGGDEDGAENRHEGEKTFVPRSDDVD